MASSETKGSMLKNVISTLAVIALVVGVVWLLRDFVITPYEVPSGSMEKTIMTNDRIFSERLSYYTRTPSPGEVITFADPLEPSRTLVKRVIATEGQTVDFKDGVLYVDNVPRKEPYTNGLPSYAFTKTAPGVEITYPFVVPAGQLWVMGDNRTNSQDSRYYGAIPVSSVSGHVCMTYWPLDHLGFIE